MFLKTLSFSVLALCLSSYWGTRAADEKPGAGQNEININDTILQFYHNCTCIPFYLCNAANKYMFAARANFRPKELKCTDPDYLCCKNATSIETDPIPEILENATRTTTEAPKSSTEPTKTDVTEDPTLRGADGCKRKCGLATTFIDLRILTPDTEAASTIPGEVPWIVEIFQEKKKSAKQPYRYKCPGTLIHPKVVLTAAHCIVSIVKTPEVLKIVASGKDTFQNLGVNSEDERNVVTIIKHPDYYSGGLFNDIALLILDKEYSFSDNFLNAICLPRANQTFDGRRCLGVGWGLNPDLESVPLNKVDVPVVDSPRCQELLRKTYLGPDFNLHSSFICAGGEEGKDTCSGDGGGPLMCLGEEYQFVQAGIVSWGIQGKCGVKDQPGVYVDVGKFVGWIEGELKKINIELKCQ